MKHHALALLGAAAGVTLVLGACAQNEGAADPPLVDAGPDRFVAPDGRFGDFDAADGDAGCAIGCSADLHYVIDCEGHALRTCGAGQGCAPGGECVPACDAAQANKSSVGCEYYAHEISPLDAQSAQCSAIYVVNTWDTPVTLSAEAQGVPVDVAGFTYLPKENSFGEVTYVPISDAIPAGESAVVFLRGQSCPKPTVISKAPPEWTDPAPTPSLSGHALHLRTSAPVIAYDFLPFGGGTTATASATLLLPVSAWDTNYVAVTPYPCPECPPPGFTVIASEDETDVTLLPNVDIEGNGGDLPPSPANTPRTIRLGKGQTLRIAQMADLTGSILESTKPVGLWADQERIQIDQAAMDCAHQQIPPIKALGSEYAGVRYPNRLEGVDESTPWRVVGLVNGTALTWEPSVPPGAPTTLRAGEVSTFRSTGPFVVRSQNKEHPFYANAYMTGALRYDGIGDVEFVNMIPTAQYLSRYMFFTDPTYATTQLVFVRAKGEHGFEDVELDCPGAVSGWNGVLADWRPVGTSGRYEYTYLDFTRVGCKNGVHTAKSEGSFGLTVWGLDYYTSYAYPAAMSTRPGHAVVVKPVPR